MSISVDGYELVTSGVVDNPEAGGIAVDLERWGSTRAVQYLVSIAPNSGRMAAISASQIPELIAVLRRIEQLHQSRVWFGPDGPRLAGASTIAAAGGAL